MNDTFPPLHFPPCKLKIEHKEGKPMVWDIVRKKMLVLTPEEWVRQHVLHFLIFHKKYSRGLIRVETEHSYHHELAKRTDLIVYDAQAKPYLLVECKASSQKISDQTFKQASVYNQTLQAPFLVVTNGLDTYCCRIDFEEKKYEFLKDFPEQRLPE